MQQRDQATEVFMLSLPVALLVWVAVGLLLTWDTITAYLGGG